MVPTQPGQPGLMRLINDRAGLALLIENGPMTRQQLGDHTGLSGPTVSLLVKRLSEAGLVCSAGQAAGLRGPSAVVYRARTESAVGVAMDVRARRIAARLVDAGGQPHPVAEIGLRGRGRTAAGDLAGAIEAACAAAGRARCDLDAVCIGVPGAVSPVTDALGFADDLPGWPRQAVRAQLGEQLGIEVLIENDANLAATAEARQRGSETDFALLWQGEGLGVANVTAGTVYQGVAGGAGEIGYMPVSRTAALIDPAATDLQHLAGSAAVIRLVRAHRASVRTFEAALAAIRDAALRPDLLAELAPRIAELIVPVIAVLDPGTVVLGGPTGAACGHDGATLVQAHLRRTTRWRTRVVATAVPDNPVLRGAELVLARHLADGLAKRVG